MKKQNFILVLAFVAFGFLACNNENIQVNEPEMSYEVVFNEIASSLGLNVTFESVEVLHGFCTEFIVPEFEFDRMTARSSAMNSGWDIDNSTTVKAVTTAEGSFATIATPRMDNSNTISYTMVLPTGEAMGFVADIDFDGVGINSFILNEEFEPVDIVNIVASGRFRGWLERYGDCVTLESRAACDGTLGNTPELLCRTFGGWTAVVAAGMFCLVNAFVVDDVPWVYGEIDE